MIVNSQMEEPNQISPEAISPLLPDPRLGVIHFNVCLPGKHTLKSLTRKALFAWWSQFEWNFIPREAVRSLLVAAGLGVIHFNVC